MRERAVLQEWMLVEWDSTQTALNKAGASVCKCHEQYLTTSQSQIQRCLSTLGLMQMNLSTSASSGGKRFSVFRAHGL